MGFKDKWSEMVAEAKAEAAKSQEEAAKAKAEAKEEAKEEGAKARVLTKGRTLSRYQNFVLRDNSIQKTKGEDAGIYSLEEFVNASVETGEELQKRYTATRILAIGVFALAFKKKTGGSFFLAIEGDSFTWLEEIPYKDKAKAMKFANDVRSAAKKHKAA